MRRFAEITSSRIDNLSERLNNVLTEMSTLEFPSGLIKKDPCGICLQDKQNEFVLCQNDTAEHSFCFSCIAQDISIKGAPYPCPMCKRPVDANIVQILTKGTKKDRSSRSIFVE